jgi:hypothetical protein
MQGCKSYLSAGSGRRKHRAAALGPFYIFIFLLTSIILQEQNRPASSVTMRDSGHHPVPNELACEASSPVSRSNLAARRQG